MILTSTNVEAFSPPPHITRLMLIIVVALVLTKTIKRTKNREKQVLLAAVTLCFSLLSLIFVFFFAFF
jgi:hypothetical protein